MQRGLGMASVRKRKGKYYAEVRLKGTYRSRTFDNKREAQIWALETEAELGRRGASMPSHTFGDACRRYQREISPTKRGRRWEEIRLEKLERDPLASVTLHNLSRDSVQAWIRRQTTGPATINRELNLIGAVLKACRARWNWMTQNPMVDLERPKDPPARDRRVNDTERSLILTALGYTEEATICTSRQQVAIAFLLALETAMRQGEIFNLTWENIALQRRFLTLPETKNGLKRDVPLSARAVQLLEKLGPQKSGPVFSVRQQVAAQHYRWAVMAAGIKGLTFHDTRHDAITRLARKLNVMDLARMVGHRDIRSLQIYYNPTAEEIAGLL